MIRIVLLAGAAAASVGVKKLRERKKQERASVDEGSGADSAVETSTTYQPTNGIAKEDSVESDAKKNVDEKANQRLGSGEAAVSAATLPASESPKTRISGSSVVPVESSPVAVFAAQTGERSNLAKASVSSPSVGRSRVSRLRLEIEGASQGDAFSFPDPGKGGSPGSIKAPPTPVTNGLSVRVADSDAGLAFSPPGETAAVALPSPVIAAVGANLPPTAAAAFVAPSTIDTVPPSLGGVNSSSSIRAPPTPSKELHSPYPETKPPLVISSGVRAVPIIPPRSRSRGPRVSVNAGLLDILPEDGTREGRVRAIPSKRPSVEPPLVRSSFTEGVFGALARSVPKGGLPFSSRSGPSSPVGSIRAPPTPLGLPKPLNPDSRGASPAPLVIRAVPTPGGAVKEEKTWEGVSLDGDSESVTSAGTNLDAASVVVSPIETESQRRVARERLSLKDRWELDAKVAERGPTDEVPPTDSRGVSVDGANPLQGRWPPTEAGRDGTEPNESGTERSKNGTERNESGMERSENGTGQNGIGAETPSLGPRELPNELIPGREKALKGLELDEERRRERLRVLEEREAVLRGQLEELEGALEERRAADVAGGPKRISDNGSKGGGGLPVGAADRFDQANFDRWCHLRAGPSGATAHWYSSGEVYSYPGGQLLARLEGFEAVRARRESARLVHELSRRLLLFVDKEKGTPLVGPGGGRLGEVRTPYQHCTYRLDASVVRTEVTVGSGSSAVRLGGTAGGVRVMQGADGVVFTRPTFLSIPSEKGDFLAYENHDYFTTTRGADATPTDHFSMVRLGPVPAFPGQCFVHVVGWKLSNLTALPAVLRAELDKEPLWKEAPEKIYD